jgi:hypothetical protein
MTQRVVGPVFVVFLPPDLSLVTRFLQRLEQMRVQKFAPNTAIATFYIAIFHASSRFDKDNLILFSLHHLSSAAEISSGPLLT